MKIYILSYLSLLIYLIGLISPLTPSVGVPGYNDIVIFCLLPIFLLTVCFLWSSNFLQRIMILFAIVGIMGSFLYLVSFIYKK